jgi:hypothetical protein
MACDLTVGRALACKSDIGGLADVYFINDGDIDVDNDITYNSNGEGIASMSGSYHAFHYALKNTGCSFTQTINSSRDSGTTFFEQVLELTIPNLTLADNKELKLLAHGNPKVIIRDNNDKYWLMGLKFGADVTGGTVVTGGAMGDLSGYTLTLTAQEPIMANLFDDTTESAIATACGFVIVKAGGVFVS